jgi:hypothetical protein
MLTGQGWDGLTFGVYELMSRKCCSRAGGVLHCGDRVVIGAEACFGADPGSNDCQHVFLGSKTSVEVIDVGVSDIWSSGVKDSNMVSPIGS